MAVVNELADFGWLNNQHVEYEDFRTKYESHQKRVAAFNVVMKHFLEAAKERAASTA